MRVRQSLLALLLLALSTPAAAQQRDVGARVSAILAAKQLQGVQVGVLVVDLGSGQTLFARNADTALIPASNTKLITTAAALELLGPKFNFTTQLYLRGKQAGKTLHGDVVVVGSGDPSFSGRFYDGDATKVLAQWARALFLQGVERVTGDLVLDTSAFSGPAIHPGWPRDQLQHWYCAPVDALNLNDNCVDVSLRPGRVGGAARYSLVPGGYFRVTNQMKTVGRGKHAPWVLRPEGSPNMLELRGTFRAGRPGQSITLSVREPAMFFGGTFKSILAENRVVVDGKVRRSAGRVEPSLLFARHACPIDRVVTVVNKRSQNLFAECLFRALGRAKGGAGSFDGGRKAVATYLSSHGITGSSVADGSGLARGNRHSPRAIVTVLQRMWKHASREVFFDSLSVAGTDGTLKRRMRQEPAKGRVHAKTGYIRSASGLSGYVKTTDGRWLAFSLLFNGFQRKGKYLSNTTIKQYQDRICQVLAR